MLQQIQMYRPKIGQKIEITSYVYISVPVPDNRLTSSQTLLICSVCLKFEKQKYLLHETEKIKGSNIKYYTIVIALLEDTV